MKLLFDENLSPKLPRLLASLFPSSAHVRDCGLKGLPDEDVWEHARIHAFTIVSKDSDFYQRSLLHGHPPRLLWLRMCNCTRDDIVALRTTNEHNIRTFDTEPTESVLAEKA
jgi:predicted nuclease of predicted toxin-antitoxin system